MIQEPRRTHRAFTLTELLVAMAVIAVVGGITVVAVRGVTEGARMSSGMNQVTSALANARAFAIKENRVVAVLFRARWDPAKPREAQRTEIVTAWWTLETIVPDPGVFLDRFEPVPDIPAQLLPPGIKVAAPWYDNNANDDVWIFTTDFPSIAAGEMVHDYGRLFAVMFGPDGNVMTFNPRSGANQLYVDFWNEDPADPGQDYDWNDPMFPESNAGGPWWRYDHPQDESNVNPAPFLAIFDFQEARERRTLDWTDDEDIKTELSGPDGYIARNGTLIQFNRYTGVIMSGGER